MTVPTLRLFFHFRIPAIKREFRIGHIFVAPAIRDVAAWIIEVRSNDRNGEEEWTKPCDATVAKHAERWIPIAVLFEALCDVHSGRSAEGPGHPLRRLTDGQKELQRFFEFGFAPHFDRGEFGGAGLVGIGVAKRDPEEGIDSALLFAELVDPEVRFGSLLLNLDAFAQDELRHRLVVGAE